MSVLTKISHNFYCHFNVSALCGGLQSRRGKLGVCGALGNGEGGEGGVKADSGAKRGRDSGAQMVCQSLYTPFTLHPRK